MESNLEKIIEYIVIQKPDSKVDFDDAKRKICNQLKISQPSNRTLLKAYQNFTKKKRVRPDKTILQLIKKADVRTLSGVAIVTSLVKPYYCPGECVYCPLERGMPKSYLASEPAAARAFSLQFDPYKQMQTRIEMLSVNGHPTDKIEFIIKGGTWNAYPIKYQYWFILESFRACNNLKRKKPKLATPVTADLEVLQKELEAEQTYNETSNHRIIGLTLETRPDAIDALTIFHMRQQGCTRVELGLQATDDKILALVKRGHNVEQFRLAMFLLRSAGFKVDLHFMPDLPGSTPKHDVEMYEQIFSDPGLKPDMVKIYPCTVIKSAPLYHWYKSGKYKPYTEKQLFGALIKMKVATPRYCRISRLIRDIPTPDIEAGNSITNLREALQKEMKIKNLTCQCLRCREVGHQSALLYHIKPEDIKLFVDQYQTTGGTEYFLSVEDTKRRVVFGFLRLRLPEQDVLPNFHELIDLKNLAFIRELHVYGQLVKIGKSESQASQHQGWGKKLMAEAENIAKQNGYKRVAVISGVGVREYYKKLGYKKEKTYMVKRLAKG